MQELTWTRRLAFGAAAGAAGGAASSLLLWMFVEPAIRRAIVIEQAIDRSHHGDVTHAGHGEMVTRTQQQIGGILAVIVVAVLLGLVFAVTYARVSHRLPGSTDAGKSLCLAGLALAVHGIVPGLIVPANPPGVGSPETVDQRTITYLAVIVLGCVFVRAVFGLHAAMVDKGLAPELRLLATVAAVGAGAIVVLAVPHVNEKIASAVPAGLIWDFRIGSLAELASMWGTIGMVHGFLIHRARTTAPSTRTPAVTGAP